MDWVEFYRRLSSGDFSPSALLMQGLGGWLLLEGGTALGSGVVRAPPLLGVTAKNVSSLHVPRETHWWWFPLLRTNKA